MALSHDVLLSATRRRYSEEVDACGNDYNNQSPTRNDDWMVDWFLIWGWRWRHLLFEVMMAMQWRSGVWRDGVCRLRSTGRVDTIGESKAVFDAATIVIDDRRWCFEGVEGGQSTWMGRLLFTWWGKWYYLLNLMRMMGLMKMLLHPCWDDFFLLIDDGNLLLLMISDCGYWRWSWLDLWFLF